MESSEKVYKVPVSGKPLITTISGNCKTPLLEVKFSNLLNPFYFPNSPSIPRYSVTCIIDPEIHKDFLNGIRTIEKNENIESILKNEIVKGETESLMTGKVLIKFQCRGKIPVFILSDNEEPQQIKLEDELAQGEKVVVIFDIMRYTKKNNSIDSQHGISFKPTSVFYLATKKS